MKMDSRGLTNRIRFGELCRLGGLAIAIAIGLSADAQASLDADATTVYLRTSCDLPMANGGAGDTKDNCVTTTAEITEWLWNGGRTNEPSALDPVTVEVGPGVFDPFVCDASGGTSGFVTVVGSGRIASVFERTGGSQSTYGTCPGAIDINSCEGLEFKRLGARGWTGASWFGGGSATWENVTLSSIAEAGSGCGPSIASAWVDHTDATSGNSTQTFEFSRLVARGGTAAIAFLIALTTNSATIQFDDGDMLVAPDPSLQYLRGSSIQAGGTSGAAPAAQLTVNNSTIRTNTGTSTHEPLIGLTGVVAVGGASVSMHGGVVNTTSFVDDVNVHSLLAFLSPTTAFTADTAFVLKTQGNGSRTRLGAFGGAAISAPYIWEQGTEPPDITSITGMDSFVETDCSSTSSSCNGGNQPHLQSYNPACITTPPGSNPWFDQITDQCRGDN